MKPRVILADDHALLLDAYETLLGSEFTIVAKVTDGNALVQAAARERPDVVIVDMVMPHLNGLDAARQLRQAQPDVCIVFLTMVDDPELAAEAIRLGACAYVLKQSAGSELSTALNHVMRGRSYVTPLLTDGIVQALATRGEVPDRCARLTPRQREVLQLLAEGHSMKEVAGILNVATRTVAFHKYRMMEHLDIKSSAQLVQFAVKHHLVA